MSAGWHSNILQMVSKVLNLMAFAFPVFKMERLDKVNPTLSESSFSDILRLAITTSRFTTIAMVLNSQIVFILNFHSFIKNSCNNVNHCSHSYKCLAVSPKLVQSAGVKTLLC